MSNKKANYRNKLLYVFFLGLFLMNSVISGNSIITNDSTLEDMLFNNTLDYFSAVDTYSMWFGSGFGSENNPDWSSTLSVLTSLLDLESIDKLTSEQNDAIESFIMNQRTTETLDNKTSKVSWWGTITRSVEAIRMLDLLGKLESTQLQEVKDRVVNYIRNNGLYLQVGGENWENTYAAIVLARNWDLFDVMGDLELPIFDLKVLNSLDNLITVGEEIYHEENVTVDWINETQSILPVVRNNNYDEFSLNIKTLGELSTNGDYYHTPPSVTLSLNWTPEEDNMTIFMQTNNKENRTYGIERGLISNVTRDTDFIVSRMGGDSSIITLPVEYEEWDASTNNYYIRVEMFDSNSNLAADFTIDINNPSITNYETPFIDMNDTDYDIKVSAFQKVHQEELVLTPQLTDVDYQFIDKLEDLYTSIINAFYDKMDEGDWTHDDVAILEAIDRYLVNEGYPNNTVFADISKTSDFIRDAYSFQDFLKDQNPKFYNGLYNQTLEPTWAETSVPIKLDTSLVITTPTLGLFKLSSPQTGSYFLNNDLFDEQLKINFYPQSSSYDKTWNELKEDNNIITMYSNLGIGSTGISNISEDTSYYGLIFSADSRESLNVLNVPKSLNFDAKDVKRTYDKGNPYVIYYDLLNSSESSFDDFLDRFEFISSISPGFPVEELLDIPMFMNLLFFYYNDTNKLFDNNFDLTLRTWKLLDAYNLTSLLFDKNDYEHVFMTYFNNTYSEKQSKEGELLGVSIHTVSESDEFFFPLTDIDALVLFIQFLTYDSDWTTSTRFVDRYSSLLKVDISVEGMGVLNPPPIKTEYQLYQEAQNEYFTQLYVDHEIDLLDQYQQSVPAIKLKSSKYMSSELMHWLSETTSINLIDQLFVIVVTTVLILSLLAFILEDYPYRLKILSLIVGAVIVFQGLSTPILQSGFNDKLSMFGETLAATLLMLEDCLYDLSKQLGSIGNIVLERPSQLSAHINTYSTEMILPKSTGTNNNTLEVSYQRYLNDFKETETLWQDLYSSSGITTITELNQSPQSYEEYVSTLAEYGIFAFGSSELDSKVQEQKIAQDKYDQRVTQRQFGWAAMGKSLVRTMDMPTAPGLMGRMVNAIRGFRPALAIGAFGALRGPLNLVSQLQVSALQNIALPELSTLSSPIFDDIYAIVGQSPQLSYYSNTNPLYQQSVSTGKFGTVLSVDQEIPPTYRPIFNLLSTWEPTTTAESWSYAFVEVLLMEKILGKVLKIVGSYVKSSRTKGVGGSVPAPKKPRRRFITAWSSEDGKKNISMIDNWDQSIQDSIHEKMLSYLNYDGTPEFYRTIHQEFANGNRVSVINITLHHDKIVLVEDFKIMEPLYSRWFTEQNQLAYDNITTALANPGTTLTFTDYSSSVNNIAAYSLTDLRPINLTTIAIDGSRVSRLFPNFEVLQDFLKTSPAYTTLSPLMILEGAGDALEASYSPDLFDYISNCLPIDGKATDAPIKAFIQSLDQNLTISKYSYGFLDLRAGSDKFNDLPLSLQKVFPKDLQTLWIYNNSVGVTPWNSFYEFLKVLRSDPPASLRYRVPEILNPFGIKRQNYSSFIGQFFKLKPGSSHIHLYPLKYEVDHVAAMIRSVFFATYLTKRMATDFSKSINHFFKVANPTSYINKNPTLYGSANINVLVTYGHKSDIQNTAKALMIDKLDSVKITDGYDNFYNAFVKAMSNVRGTAHSALESYESICQAAELMNSRVVLGWNNGSDTISLADTVSDGGFDDIPLQANISPTSGKFTQEDLAKIQTFEDMMDSREIDAWTPFLSTIARYRSLRKAFNDLGINLPNPVTPGRNILVDGANSSQWGPVLGKNASTVFRPDAVLIKNGTTNAYEELWLFKVINKATKHGWPGQITVDAIKSKNSIGDPYNTYSINVYTRDIIDNLVASGNLTKKFGDSYIQQMNTKNVDAICNIVLPQAVKTRSTIPRIAEVASSWNLVGIDARGQPGTVNDANVTQKMIDKIIKFQTIDADQLQKAVQDFVGIYGTDFSGPLYKQLLRFVTKELWESFLKVNKSPSVFSPTMGYLLNNSDNLNDFIPYDNNLAEIVSVELLNEDFTRPKLGGEGYISGNVEGATLTALLESGKVNTLNMNVPSTIDVMNLATINNATAQGWDVHGLVDNGIYYPSDSSEDIRTNPYGLMNGRFLVVNNQDLVVSSSWDDDTKDDYARISSLGLQQLFGVPRLNIVDYPLFNWSWNIENINEDTHDVNTANSYNWSVWNWMQGQLTIDLTDGISTKRIALVATPYQSTISNSYIVGPDVDKVVQLEPIVWIREVDSNGDEDTNDRGEIGFEHPLVPESVDLLQIAINDFGFSADEIWITEIGFGPGYNTMADLLIENMFLTSGLNSELAGFSQIALKSLVKVIEVDMGGNPVEWDNWIDTNTTTYQQMALELSCGMLDDDYGLNAIDWVSKARQSDQYDEFRHFFTDGIILIRNTGNGTPYYTRAVFAKQKQWASTSEDLSAPVWNNDQINQPKKIRIFYDALYENGWNKSFWYNVAASIQQNIIIASEELVDVKMVGSEELAEFMLSSYPEGMVIFIGALPDWVWSTENPQGQSQTTSYVLANYSILEYYMTHGGTVFTTGQHGGGWEVATLDQLTGEVTIGDYSTYSVDITDVINYPYDTKQSSASFMENHYINERSVGSINYYYSLGLYHPNIAGSIDPRIQQIISSGPGYGSYHDLVWTVEYDGSGTLESGEQSGMFISFHTGTDDFSPGAITPSNATYVIRDIVSLILGTEIRISASEKSVNPTWTPSETLDTGSSNNTYFSDTFETSAEGWSNITSSTIHDEPAGLLSGNNTTKSIDGISATDYPNLNASIYIEDSQIALPINGTSTFANDYLTWGNQQGTNFSATSTTTDNIEGTNANQFYFRGMQDSSATLTPSSGNLKMDPVSFMTFAINPYVFESYEASWDEHFDNSLKTVFTNSVSGGNKYLYEDLTSVTNYTIQSGDYLEYDILLPKADTRISVDLEGSGWNLRDSGSTDQCGLSSHPNTDISANALNQWYHRRIDLNNCVDESIIWYSIVCENDEIGTYTAYLKNIKITNGVTTNKEIFEGTESFTHAPLRATSGFTITQMVEGSERDDHPSEFWMELKIDDGTGTSNEKYLRYYFNVESPVWHNGQIVTVPGGMNNSYFYDGDSWELRGIVYDDGIAWIPISINSEINTTQPNMTLNSMDGNSRGGWTQITRNILSDYNTKFEQNFFELEIKQIKVHGYVTAAEAWVLLDDLMFYDVGANSTYMKTQITDGENNASVYITSSDTTHTCINGEGSRFLGEVWWSYSDNQFATLTGNLRNETQQNGLKDSTINDGSWISLSGSVDEACYEFAYVLPNLNINNLVYQDNLEIFVSNTSGSVYIDNVTMTSYNQIVLNTPNIRESINGLSLKISDNGYIYRDLDSSYRVSDYNNFLFSTRVAAIPNDDIEDLDFSITIKNGAGTEYKAWLSDNGETSYTLMSDTFLAEEWNTYVIDLYSLKDVNNNFIPFNAQFDYIELECNSSLVWYDDFILTGKKGTIFYDSFDDLTLNTNYGSSTAFSLTSDIGKIPWTGSSVTIISSIDTHLSNTGFIIDMWQQDRFDLIVEGEGNISVKMFGFKEDGSLYSSTPFAIITNSSLTGWGHNDIVTKNLHEYYNDEYMVDDEIRFLGMPTIEGSGEFIVKSLFVGDVFDLLPTQSEYLEIIDQSSSSSDFYLFDSIDESSSPQWNENGIYFTDVLLVSDGCSGYLDFNLIGDTFEQTFMTKLVGSDDAFSWTAKDYRVEYSSSGTSYLKRGGTQLDSNSTDHPLTNTSFSAVKLIVQPNYDTSEVNVSVWIDGELFLSVNDTLQSQTNDTRTFIDIPMYENTGTTVYDISGNDENGTCVSTSWDSTNGLYFDGSADYVILNSSEYDYLSDVNNIDIMWSIDINVKSGGSGTDYIIGGGGETGGDQGVFALINRSTNMVQIGIATDDSGTNTGTTIDFSDYIDEWHTISFTHNGSAPLADRELAVFVDGELIDIYAATSRGYVSDKGSVRLGVPSASTSYGFYGYMRNTRVYINTQFIWQSPSASNDFYLNNVGLIILDNTPLPHSDVVSGNSVLNLPMNESCNNKVYDLSGNSINGTISGATWDSDGVLNFDGTSDYIEIADNSLLKPEEISVSAWVRLSPDANTSIRHIFLCKWYGYSFELEASTMKPYFRIADGGDSPKGPCLVPGEWYHLVGTYEPGVGNSLFVNGTKIGTTYDASPINHSTYPLHIGKYRGGIYFDGSIRDVRIWDFTLDDNEILTRYRYIPDSMIIPESIEVLDMPLIEGVGISTRDYSGNNYDGTISGATWTSEGLYFDGTTSDYVTLDTAVSDGLTDYTIAFWFNTDDISKSLNTVFHATDTGGNNLGICLTSTGMTIYTVDGAETMGYSFSDNTWYHVGIVRDGSTFYYYVNGALDETDPTWSTVIDSDGYVLLGQEQDSVGGGFDVNQAFEGYLKDFLILDSSLSSTQVKKLFLSGNYTTNIVASWDLTNSYIDPITEDEWIIDNSINCLNASTDSATLDLSENAFYFDGLDDYIPIGSTSSGSPFTISILFNSESVSNYRNLFHTNWGETNTGVRVEQYSGGNLKVGCSADNVWRSNTITTSLSSNTWNHLVIVGDSINNRIKAYLNGVETLNASHTSWLSTFNNMVLGKGYSSDSNRHFKGHIGYVQIFDSVLSQQDILDLIDASSALLPSESIVNIDPVGDADAWNYSGYLSIPDGTEGDMLSFVLDSEAINITADDLENGKMNLSTDSDLYTSNDPYLEGFESGLSGWSVVDNPGGMTFTQSTANTRAGTYSAVHLMGSSSSSQYRIDRWDTPGTHSEGTFEGWVKSYTGSNYEVMAFMPLLVDKDNFYGAYFYNWYLKVFSVKAGVWTWYPDSNGYNLGETSSNKWWWFKATVEDGSPSDFMTIEYKRDGWSSSQTTGQITLDSNNNLGEGYAAIRARGGFSFWDYHWDELKFTPTTGDSGANFGNYNYSGESPMKLSLPLIQDLQDKSIYDQTVTANGGTFNNEGFLTDGTDDYITLTDLSTSDFTTDTDFKISMWVRYDGSDITNRIPFGQGGTGSLYIGVNSSDYWDIGFDDSGYGSANTVKAYPDQWYYLELINIYDESGDDSTAKLYVNGNEAISKTKDIFTPPYKPVIGCYNYNNGSDYQYDWMGPIHSFRFEYDNITPIDPNNLKTYASLIDTQQELPFSISLSEEDILSITVGGKTITTDYTGTGNLDSVVISNQSSQPSIAAFGMFESNNNTTIGYLPIDQYGNQREIEVYSNSGASNISYDNSMVSATLDSDGKIGFDIPIPNNIESEQTYRINVLPFVNNFGTNECHLFVEPQVDDLFEWTLIGGASRSQLGEPDQGFLTIGDWHTLTFNSSDSGLNQEFVRIYIENTDDSTSYDAMIFFGDITVIEDDIFELAFIPYPAWGVAGNNDQSVFMDNDGSFVVRDNNKITTDTDYAAALIPNMMTLQEYPLSNDSYLEFEFNFSPYILWKDITAGIKLELDDVEYDLYSTSEMELFIHLGTGSTLPTSLTVDGSFTYEYSGDTVDEWRTFSMSFAEIITRVNNSSFTYPRANDILLNHVAFYLDQNGENSAADFKIRNLRIANRPLGVIDLIDRRAGNRFDSNSFLQDWLMSPIYDAYADNTDKVIYPKTNILQNGDFEDGDDHWRGYSDVPLTRRGHFPSLDYAFIYRGMYAAHISDDHPGGGTYICQDIEYPLNRTVDQDVLVSFWVNGGDDDLTFGFVTSSPSTENSITYYDFEVDSWSLVQEVFTLSTTITSGDLEFAIYANGSFDYYIDDVRIEPIPAQGSSNPERIYRGFDPENMNDLVFWDGWYRSSYFGSISFNAEDTTITSGALEPKNTTQFFYNEFWVDNIGASPLNDWKMMAACNKDLLDVMWVLWINGEIQGVRYTDSDNYTTPWSNIELQRGKNTVLMQFFSFDRDASDEGIQYRITLEKDSWGGTTVTTLTPNPKPTKTPYIYYDQNHDTEWITRDTSDSNLILDMDLARPSENLYINMADRSGNDMNGTLNGNAYYNEYGIMQFDGSGDYVQIPRSKLPDMTGDLSFSFWAQPIMDGSRRNPIGTSYGDEFQLTREPSGTLNYYHGQTTTSGQYMGAGWTNIFDSNDWVHITIVRDHTAKTITCFKNGVNQGTSGVYTINPSTGNSHLVIGEGYAFGWRGQLSDVKIWDRTLCETEVKNLLYDGQLPSEIKDNPRNIANAISASFYIRQIPSIVIGAARMKFVIDTELNMNNSSNQTTWHPFSTILLTHDSLPVYIFDGSDDSPIEDFLETGGKLTCAPGYVPFSYKSYYGAGVTAVSSTGYGYDGALGHQRVLDITDDNDSDGRQSTRTDFEYGMFAYDTTLDFSNDDYAVIIDETTAPTAGTTNNTQKFNYEPIAPLNQAFTFLPHTGYKAHMVIGKSEYDAYFAGPQYNTGDWEIYNGDGYSGSKGVGGYSGNFDNPEEIEDVFLSPLDAELWFKPYLADTYGAIEDNPSTYYYEGFQEFYHHFERAFVGTASVQGGQNAKGIVNILPLIDWSENIIGLNTEGSSVNQGKWGNRGYGSLTNSPSTEEAGLLFMSVSLGEMMVSMTIDSISINACRDNNTSGTNFLNFNTQAQATTSKASASGYDDRVGPIVVAENDDGDTEGSWISSYPIFGGEHGRAIANRNNSSLYGYWRQIMYPSVNDTDHNELGEIPALTDLAGERDSIITLINLDGTGYYGDIVFQTIGGIDPDYNSDNDAELSVSMISNKTYYDSVMTYSNITHDPLTTYDQGYNFGINTSGDIQSLDIGDSGDVNYQGWDIFDTDIIEYTADRVGQYSNSDTEMVSRQQSLVVQDLTDSNDYYDANLVRYVTPILPLSTNYDTNDPDLLDLGGFSGLPSYLYDGSLGSYAGQSISNWDLETGYNKSPNSSFTHIEWTTPPDEVTGVMWYFSEAMNPLRSLRMKVIDDVGEVLLNQIFNIPAPQRIGGDSESNTLLPTSPIWLGIPEQIADKNIQRIEFYPVRAWIINESGGSAGAWSEVRIFGRDGSNNHDPWRVASGSLEFIERTVERHPTTEDEITHTNYFNLDDIEYTMYDNGDTYYNDQIDKYVSSPNQSGSQFISISTAQLGNFDGDYLPSLRWNLNYSAPVSVTSGYPDRNLYHDMAALQQAIIFDFLLIFLIILIVSIITLGILGYIGGILAGASAVPAWLAAGYTAAYQGFVLIGIGYGMFNLSIMIINMVTGWNLPDLHDMFTYAYNLTRDGFSHCPSYMQEIAWVWLLLDFACDLEGTLVRNVYYGPNAFDWDTMQWDMSRGQVWQYHFGDD